MATDPEPNKRRFNPSMSRRTRKTSTAPKGPPGPGDQLQKSRNGVEHVSLKQLMKEGDGEEKANQNVIEVAGALVSENKNLAIVAKQSEGAEGVKMAGMMRRYVKVLNHLIKAKQDAKKRTTVPPLLQ